jgi:uncharacterized radical SAM protein YgiQ
MINTFLPVSKDDLIREGWEQCDFILVSGDAYVDHPSFGMAIISRVLDQMGYKVGVIAQPDWNDDKAFEILGIPKYGFLISGGNMDSMVNHYTVNKKRRKQDAYSPGGVSGLRPDRCVIVYGNILRRLFPNIPIIIGGIEASLRRFVHYDYWSDKIRKSILLDSCADLLIYGMGESAIVEVAESLSSGMKVQDLIYIKGTSFKTKTKEYAYDYIELSSYETLLKSKKEFARIEQIIHEEQDPIRGKTLLQYQDGWYVVQNPPREILSKKKMDWIYELNYQRKAHPMYNDIGGIPALEEVRFSLTSNRGCFGSCNFCAIGMHQGRIIQARSHESLIKEAKVFTEDDKFKGYIHDVGGPTANFRKPSCKKQLSVGTCKNKQCLFPKVCKNVEVDHKDYLQLLRKLRKLKKVKKVFIRSGIRYDYVMADPNRDAFKEIVEHHISGCLKVAPEHISDNALKYMGKPSAEIYHKFRDKYYEWTKELGKNQHIIPYLISSCPGTTLRDSIELAIYLKSIGYRPEKVQDFYPTPGTISTAMYYSGYDPRTLNRVYVPMGEEKKMQRALLQFHLKENRNLVIRALEKEKMTKYIGNDKMCLVSMNIKNNRKRNNRNIKKK